MKKESNPLAMFFIGLVMLSVGLYWFMSKVDVSMGFYSMSVGGFSAGGLIIVPFIVGIIWLFVKPSSIMAKLIIVLGILIIIASVVMGTKFRMTQTNLYEYLIMMILVFGGGALDLRVMFSKPKE